MKVELVETGSFSTAQQKALDELRAAVYPPEVVETLPGRLFRWAEPQWSVLLWDEGQLVTRVGLLQREIISNGTQKKIGGIGRVMTHPAKQRQGLAGQALDEAHMFFDTELGASYALLFCQLKLVRFYKRLGWKTFSGKVFVEQPAGKVDFSANGAMLMDVTEKAPKEGTLDLNGLPW